MTHLVASTPDEFAQHCETLASANPKKRLFFRGQTHDHSPIPSELRPIDEKARLTLRYQRSLWRLLAVSAVFAADGKSDDIAASCLLQHYGFRSWFIDVTSEPQIALWFATQRYECRPAYLHSPRLAADGTHLHSGPPADDTLELAVATYRPSGANGHIYVYAVADGDPHFLDLQSRAPHGAERVRRQRGYGLYPTSSHDYQGLEVAHIEVAFDVADLRSADGVPLTADYLFPGPIDDAMYRFLLRLPRVVGRADDGSEREAAEDPFNLPIYGTSWMFDYAPELLKRAIRGDTGYCTTCRGLTKSTVELPITPPGGAANHTFKPDHLLDAAQLPRANLGGSRRPIDPSGWPTGPLFLRVNVLRDVARFVLSDDPFPLLRGYVVDFNDRGGSVREVNEFRGGHIELHPSPWLPAPVLDLSLRLDIDEAIRKSWNHECTGGTAAEMCPSCQRLQLERHSRWLGEYARLLSAGAAYLRQNSPNHYAYYWDDPDGVQASGAPWPPPRSPLGGDQAPLRSSTPERAPDITGSHGPSDRRFFRLR